jgi:hypothetical protein
MSSGGASLGHCRVACAACMKTFKRLFKHLLQSPACILLYTTSNDPEQQQQVIDDARCGSSVAALPTARVDNEFCSNNEGLVFSMRFPAITWSLLKTKRFHRRQQGSCGQVSTDQDFDANKDVSVDNKEVTLPNDEVSSEVLYPLCIKVPSMQ